MLETKRQNKEKGTVNVGQETLKEFQSDQLVSESLGQTGTTKVIAVLNGRRKQKRYCVEIKTYKLLSSYFMSSDQCCFKRLKVICSYN